MPAPRLASVLALLPLVAAGGCCSMARLFCGPDKSPWVSVDRGTHGATMATFLEALRRDDPQQVYFCLSAGYKQRNGVSDSLAANVAYAQLKERIPYLHLAGYLAVPDQPARTQDGGVSYVLDLDGRPLRIDLIRQSYWMVRYHTATGEDRESSGSLDGDTFNGRATVASMAPDDLDRIDRSRITLEPFVFEHPRSPAVALEQVDAVGLGREWKIDNLVLPE